MTAQLAATAATAAAAAPVEPTEADTVVASDTPAVVVPEAVNPLKIAPVVEPIEAQPLLAFDDITSEFTEKGQLSDETLVAIESAGIPRAYVEVYLAGLASLQQQANTAAFAVTGGEENYKAMLGWAQASLTDAEVNAFNQAVGMNNETRNLAVQGLYAKFGAANGSEGATLQGNLSSTAASYANWGDVKEAMKDKRYGKDKSYTQVVQNTLKNSKL